MIALSSDMHIKHTKQSLSADCIILGVIYKIQKKRKFYGEAT